jgi:putative DNA primase/helicase
VVAPGSYVPVTEDGLKEKIEAGEITEQQKQDVLNDPDRGYYTLDNDKEIAQIRFEELPEVFREQYNDSDENSNESEGGQEEYERRKKQNSGNQSVLFDLEITDLTGRGFKGRDAHPLHPSGTGANWSISKGVGHCWRHLVSLNAIQYLCVEAGYLTCLEAGSPHYNSNTAGSEVTGSDEAIWVAWKQAKETNCIPEDDPIPTRAMKHIARKHDVAQFDDDRLLTTKSYNRVLEIVEEEY